MLNKSSRLLEISFAQALEWYYGENPTLQELALKLYSEEELDVTLIDIHANPNIKFTKLPVTENSSNKLSVLADLMAIADVLNDGWKKTKANVGYYITSVPSKEPNTIELDIKSSMGKSTYTVYFKSNSAAKIAKQILHNRLKYLFQ